LQRIYFGKNEKGKVGHIHYYESESDDNEFAQRPKLKIDVCI
jgi:hypothetical protein